MRHLAKLLNVFFSDYASNNIFQVSEAKALISSGKIQFFPCSGFGANPVISHAHLAHFPWLPEEGWDTWKQRLDLAQGCEHHFWGSQE